MSILPTLFNYGKPVAKVAKFITVIQNEMVQFSTEDY